MGWLKTTRPAAITAAAGTRISRISEDEGLVASGAKRERIINIADVIMSHPSLTDFSFYVTTNTTTEEATLPSGDMRIIHRLIILYLHHRLSKMSESHLDLLLHYGKLLQQS